MEPPAFWRDLQVQFRALHAARPDTYALDARDGTWRLGNHEDGRPSGAAVRAQFEALATRAALAANPGEGRPPLDAWLNALTRGPHFSPVASNPDLRPGEVVLEGGWIDCVCLASAEYCVQLETVAYQAQGDLAIAGQGTDGAGTPRPVSARVIERRQRLVWAHRQQHDLTAEGFARQLGISESALRGIIREDRRRFALGTRDRLLKALGMSEDEWYSG